MPRVLSQSMIDGYRRDGFLFPVRAFSAVEAAVLSAKVEEMEARIGAELQSRFRIKAHLPFPWLCDVVRNPRLLDAVEDIIGPDILCWGASFFSKKAHDPRFISWHNDTFFYSMEWCSGGSLADATRLERGAERGAVADAARAAHALHEAGIAHRDIRPSNILLRADGSAVLSDLGLAQIGAGSVTSMAPMASIGFMDPGLLLGETAGRATDIYALGATLHWVLTGCHLFPGLDPTDPMLAVRTVLRHPAHVQRELLSTREADLITACIDQTIAARPSTAEAFATLVDAIQGE